MTQNKLSNAIAQQGAIYFFMQLTNQRLVGRSTKEDAEIAESAEAHMLNKS